jgi:RimJ/RimL family protein N-acetyltransferase
LAALFDVVTNRSDWVAAWANETFQTTFVPPYHAFGILKDDKLIGAAVFNGYEGKNIELSCVGRGAFNRTVCHLIAKTAFEVNDCERITVKTRADNEYVVRVAQKFGWKIEGLLRHYYGETDCIIMGMLKSECRFLR